MKKIIYALSCVLACSALAACGGGAKVTPQGGAELEAGFVAPPDTILTSAYWYWISDNISKEGVVKDLQAMKEAGINRAFIGNIGLTDEETGGHIGNVKFYSDEWWDITHTALKTATELGIEIGMFNSPGWSQSGGPWVKPEQAMRYLYSIPARVTGGQKVEITLPRPEGKFKDNFQDVRVIAYPAVSGALLSQANASVSSTPAVSGISALIDGNGGSEATFARGDVEIDFKANEPFTLRGVKIYGSNTPIDSPAVLAVKEGAEYKTLAEFDIDRYNFALNVGFEPFAPIVMTVPATTAQEFRLTIKGLNQGAKLREVELSSAPFVERYPEKTLAKMFPTPLPYWDDYLWRAQPELDDASLAVDPASVLDISEFLKGDVLSWEAPQGEWIVVRTGMLPTGTENAPARAGAVGLETDKMSKEHIRAHFDAFIGQILARVPAEDRKTWKVVVEDSYETGGQNFTDGMLEEFAQRYGYDPLPYLPVFDGVVVGSEDLSDRFLWDVRRMIADKVAYDYVGGLREISNQNGLKTWLENYGHWGFPGEFLMYGGQSDEIGGEFWSEGELGNIENRAATSAGHIYGKQRISAESFTAGGGGYHRYPAMMKQRGDRFFAEGINNTLLHLITSQPYEDKVPGVNAPFGNEFNRLNTWYPQMDLFTSYLKRVNYMLQQGLNVADVAYFIGEDAPKMTGVASPALPKGYQFDYMNAEVIVRDMTVKDGMLTLPHGTQYSILVLPKLETMRPEVLTKIKQLIEQGGVVMGPAPMRSPSMQNYPAADQQVSDMATELWSQIDPATKYARIGKGMLINEGVSMEEAFAMIERVPDVRLQDIDMVDYGHRTVNGIEIYFLSNQSDQPVSITPEFRVECMQPELWDGVTGKVRDLPSFSQTKTGTVVPLKLDTYESAFIVFRKAGKGKGTTDVNLNFPEPAVLATLENGWSAAFEKERRGPEAPVQIDKLFDLSTSSDFDIQHYSGKIVYSNKFNLDAAPATDRIYVDLNDLSAMAKVTVNGKYAGGVWTPPYRVDITDFVQAGENTIVVDVVTTWVNRLIGDLNLPESQRLTWIAFQPWKASDKLWKSGLIGPVQIESVQY